MRKLICILIACFALSQANAQSDVFSRGAKVINLGVGMGSTWYSGTYYKVFVPPLTASLEFGVADFVIQHGSIGIGPCISYSTFRFEKGDGGYDYSTILPGMRVNYHYPLAANLDTYASLFLGYNILSSTEFGFPNYPPESGGLKSAFYVGGRYYIGEIFGVMAEIGYGISYFNAGISLKF